MKILKITGNGMPRSTRVYLDEIEIPVRAVSGFRQTRFLV